MENNQYQHIPQEKFAFAQLNLNTSARFWLRSILLSSILEATILPAFTAELNISSAFSFRITQLVCYIGFFFISFSQISPKLMSASLQ